MVCSTRSFLGDDLVLGQGRADHLYQVAGTADHQLEPVPDPVTVTLVTSGRSVNNRWSNSVDGAKPQPLLRPNSGDHSSGVSTRATLPRLINATRSHSRSASSMKW